MIEMQAMNDLEYLRSITDRYLERLGGQINAENIDVLDANEHTLLGLRIMFDECLEGGFVQMIQNGYGPYVLSGPLPKLVKTIYGLKQFSSFLYDVRKEYHRHKAELEADCSDDEFMAKYEAFDQMNDYGDALLDDYMEDVLHRVRIQIEN